MKINDLGDLFSLENPFGQWGEFASISELHLNPGQEYRIRLIGPTYKARRTYVSRRNEIVRSLDSVTFYIEEDKEYNYIKSDPKKVIEHEGVDPCGFIEIN